jgi:hypothetical protein
MEASLVTKLQELIHQGDKLVPEGGLELSGYNAKMQSQYLLWRKNCLDALSKWGQNGPALRSQLTNDENGAYFYQTSAQRVHDALKEALKSVEVPPPPTALSSAAKPATEVEKRKIGEPLKYPAPKSVLPSANRALVFSASNNPLLSQLTSLLKELGIEASVYRRTGGGSDALLAYMDRQSTTPYAFYLIGSDDIPSAMFEMGYLVGKIGANKVCCIYQKDAAVPKNIPGVQRKEIIVKVEEISFSLVKELKGAGYSVSI